MNMVYEGLKGMEAEALLDYADEIIGGLNKSEVLIAGFVAHSMCHDETTTALMNMRVDNHLSQDSVMSLLPVLVLVLHKKEELDLLGSREALDGWLQRNLKEIRSRLLKEKLNKELAIRDSKIPPIVKPKI